MLYFLAVVALGGLVLDLTLGQLSASTFAAVVGLTGLGVRWLSRSLESTPQRPSLRSPKPQSKTRRDDGAAALVATEDSDA